MPLFSKKLLDHNVFINSAPCLDCCFRHCRYSLLVSKQQIADTSRQFHKLERLPWVQPAVRPRLSARMVLNATPSTPCLLPYAAIFNQPALQMLNAHSILAYPAFVLDLPRRRLPRRQALCQPPQRLSRPRLHKPQPFLSVPFALRHPPPAPMALSATPSIRCLFFTVETSKQCVLLIRSAHLTHAYLAFVLDPFRL